jgi:amidase
VLLTPTIGEPPVPVGKWDSRRGLWTLAGMTRRTGFTREGLPLSVQLVGRPDDEATLLSLAAQNAAERPWADRRPPVS